MTNKVILGMSGGVDSSAAAAILKNNGYEIIGCNMLFTEFSNTDSEETALARNVAENLGIDFITPDFRDIFKKNVTDYFIREYYKGFTPNPCVICNPTTKFFSLMSIMEQNNAQYIATGHYAKIIFDLETQKYKLYASHSKKDQSYFLYRLPQEYLKHIIFPLGSFDSKQQVREYADINKIETATKRDSQEICFIPKDDYATFILNKSGNILKPGNFIDNEGNVIGKHKGIIYYTAGQRKGLGAFGKPYYVKNINATDNTITLCTAEERFLTHIVAENLSWCSGLTPVKNFIGNVKVRSTAVAQRAEISISNNTMSVNFDSPVLCPSPGQSAVVYIGDEVLGGGIITHTK